jgi:polysaccharide export outer membrane protein
MTNRFGKSAFRGVSVAAAMIVGAGCSHAQAAVQQEQVKAQEFRLSREDVVEVSVWKEPELSRIVPVRPDGKITLPLVGDLAAEGLRPTDLEQSVRKQLAPLVRDPRVTVIVHDVNGSRVFVAGQVAHPGAFPLRSQMNVLQALALAGGLAEFADRGGISVLHADGRKSVVEYDDMVNGRANLSLAAGDTIVVP